MKYLGKSVLPLALLISFATPAGASIGFNIDVAYDDSTTLSGMFYATDNALDNSSISGDDGEILSWMFEYAGPGVPAPYTLSSAAGDELSFFYYDPMHVIDIVVTRLSDWSYFSICSAAGNTSTDTFDIDIYYNDYGVYTPTVTTSGDLAEVTPKSAAVPEISSSATWLLLGSSVVVWNWVSRRRWSVPCA